MPTCSSSADFGLVMASRVLGVPIPERVTGGDLMERMCAEAAHYGFRVLLSGRPARGCGARRPSSALPLPGFADLRDLLSASGIRKRSLRTGEDSDSDRRGGARSDLCGVWSAEAGDLDAGESSDFKHRGDPRGRRRTGYTGRVAATSPTLFPDRRVQWLFRLAMEPRRLVAQYPIGNARFVLLVFRQWAGERWAALRRRIAERFQKMRAESSQAKGRI